MRREGVEAKIVRNPRGMPKMSEVLRQFLDPYWFIPDDEESMRKLITTALVAWNTALLPEAERPDQLTKIAEALPEETHEDFYAIVGEMIARKEKYFAKYDRTIVRCVNEYMVQLATEVNNDRSEYTWIYGQIENA